MTTPEPDRLDLLHGMMAIAAALGITRRQAQHLHETKLLPTFKLGGAVCARRSTLAAWIAAREADTREKPVNG